MSPSRPRLVVKKTTPVKGCRDSSQDDGQPPTTPGKDAVSLPDAEVSQFVQTPHHARIGSPRRPMSAQVAFRKEARGISLRRDVYVAPTIMFAQRLGVHPRPLPLFPDQSKFQVTEDPHQKLTEVLVALVESLQLQSTINDTADSTSTANDKTASKEVRPKSPVGLKMFVRPKATAGALGQKKTAGDDSDMDVDAIAKRIMDQSRKLSTHLQDVWAGHIILNRSEADTVNFIIKERLLPTLDTRIHRLNDIIADMMPDGVTELKETPQSVPRDLISFEVELEKRLATKQALARDLRCITHKMIGFKRDEKGRELHRSAVRLRLQSAKLKIDAKRTADEAALDTRDDKAHFIAVVIKMLEGKDAKSKMEGIQYVGMEGIRMLKRATSQDAKHLRDSFVDCCFTPRFMSVRRAALPLLATEGILFNFVPVREVPPKPEQTTDPAARDNTDYNIIFSDNEWLSALFLRAAVASCDVQEDFMNAICKIVRIDDRERMQELLTYLKSPAPNVRVAAVRCLAAHTSGHNSLETLQQVAALEKDDEWTVRAAICEAMPNISGMLQTLAAREVMQPYQVRVTQKDHNLLFAMGEDAEEDVCLDDMNPVLLEEIAFQQERKEIVKDRFKTGMRQAVRYSTREKEMRNTTVQVLERMVTDDSSNVRRAAIRTYAKIGKPGTRHAVSIVLAGCRDESSWVRAASFASLPSILNRSPPDEDQTVEWKFEKKATREWVVEQLVALIDPDTALNSDPVRPWKQPITPELRKDMRQRALTALVGEQDGFLAQAGIVPKAHLAVIQGFAKHIYQGNVELKLEVLRLLPDVTTPTCENHHLAVLPVLHCLTSESDAVRQTAALVLQTLVDINNDTTIGQLVTLLGAGRDHMFGDGTKRSAVALLVQLQKQSPSGLRDDALKAHNKYLHDVAFGLNSGTHAYHKYDEESIMEPMMEIEAKTLDLYPSEEFVAKGLACHHNPGSSGFDASHWKRRLLLLKKEGALLMTSARSKQDPAIIFSESCSFSATRVSYGSIVPHAIKIEVQSDTGSKDSNVLGFFTRDEATIWFSDFQNIVQRNARRAAMELKDVQASGQADVKTDEAGSSYLGKTARNLDHFVNQLLNPVTVADAGLKEKQNFVQVQLSRLVNDSKAFVEAAEGATQASNRWSRKTSVDKGAAEDAHLHVKLDMAALLQLLRANSLYGKTGFTEQAVRHAWKVANAGDGSAANQSSDKDKLKLDWLEYQTIIRLLASKAGVVLHGDTQDMASAEVSPEMRQLREAAGVVLSKHWNDAHMFLRFAAGTTQGPSKTSAHVLGDAHLKTMDYREFIGLCTHLKIFPVLLSRTRLSDIFKEANDSTDRGDSGGHEFTFEEYKAAMVGIASALELPILCNGRNLASKLKFSVKKRSSVVNNLK